MREHAMLSVVIPTKKVKGLISQPEYVGVGQIKKVLLKAGDPMLTVILQIDIIDKLDFREKRQKVPEVNVEYESKLSFRLKYDSAAIAAHKSQVQQNLREAKG